MAGTHHIKERGVTRGIGEGVKREGVSAFGPEGSFAREADKVK